MTDTTYPKINGLYKRGEKGAIIEGEYARPEFAYLRHLPWQWTEKVDGTNIRLTYDGSADRTIAAERCVQGRTDAAQIPPKLLAACADIMRTCPFPDVFPDASTESPVVLYGEGFGPGIQKGGGNYRDTPGFVLFDVRVGPWWLSRPNVEDVAQRLGIDVVPVVTFGQIGETADIVVAEHFVREDKIRSRWLAVDHPEGIVGRPVVPLFDAKGERVTVKIKRRDYAR